MNNPIWLSEAHMRRNEPYFPLSHGVPRVDGCRINVVICCGLRWRDAPAAFGSAKTSCNRFIRWSRMGAFNRIFVSLALEGGKPDQLMINAPSQGTLHGSVLVQNGVVPRCIERARSGLKFELRSSAAVMANHSLWCSARGNELYRWRHKIENMFGKLKDWRRRSILKPARIQFFAHSAIAFC